MLRSTWTYFGLGALVGAALFWVSDSSGWLVTPGLGDVAEAPLAPREERIEGSRPASSAVQEQSSTRPPTSTTSSSGLTTTSSDPVCELPLCQLHERSAPQLFILEHTDGAGHRMKSILEAMAIAWRNKMNFGGLVGQLQPLTDQHINFRVISDAIFGEEASKDLYIYNISNKPRWEGVFDSVRQLESGREHLKEKAFAYCHAVNEWGYDRSIPTSSYFPGWLRDGMRKHLDTRPLLFAAGKVSVVIHLRRSDLERGDTRATPDEYYYRLAKEIGQILPAELLDFHVWSSTKNIPAYDYHYWTSKDYDGYRERGMTVHLDEQIDNNDDMIKAWTHMARADIFIMSQSSFSMVPAYMNTNCVIYPSNIDAPLENWINGRNEARESYKQELEACVGRAQKHAGVAATTGSAGVENEKVPQVREKTEMESKTCNLKVCNLHEAQVPRLYILEHTDGAGHRMKSILEAIAIAWRNTLNFGGVVGQLQPLTDQHINFRVIVDALFGPDASRDFFLYNISSRPNFAMEFENVRKLEAGAKQLPAGALVYCSAVNEWGYDRSIPTSSYFPGWLRNELRQHLDTRPLLFAAGKVSVVIHLRRSDLERSDTRATPDAYYYRLAKEIGHIVSFETLDFHVWSSTKNIPAYDYHYWTSKDYDGYRERGMTVHLDEQIDNNDDMIKAWTHMARADIFIMSQSSFSMVPAYLNTNCVIYPSNIDAPLENWVDGKDNKRSQYQASLQKCVARAVEGSQTERRPRRAVGTAPCADHFAMIGPIRFYSPVGSFLVANWLISNLAYSNFFLQPRGPDETTRWQGYGFDFVHNLLHMTGEKVLQPFHDPDRRLVALFNGEIYNWEELGSELGSSFRSDGEVILSEYQRHGGSFVRRLDGEFALALFDFQRRELILARDPFGTKPLWFASSAALGRFACASYRSALERLGFEEQDIHQVEPNTALHLRLPSTEAGEAEAPVVIHQAAVFEFDMRQHKADTKDWQKLFLKAIQKRAGSTRFAPGRAVPAMCLSDGYDSGSIAVALGELGIAPAMYTVQAREDVRVLLARLEAMRVRHMNASWKLTQLSQEEFQREKTFLRENAEKVFYKLRPGYANVDDKAAAGLSWIYRQAAHFGQRLFLSGSGADEVISDYGAYGAPLEFHSTLMGHFPENLSTAFPWLNFYLGTQQDYLAKEESTAGAHGVETRYPFLDRSLVQEFLWLSNDAKNSLYKAPIHEFLASEQFPFVPGVKRGFSADRNLAGSSEGHDDAGAARARLWARARARERGDGGEVETATVAACSHQCEEEGSFSLEELMEVVELESVRIKDLSEALPALQRARARRAQQALRPPLSLAAANGVEPTPGVVILTSCMEEHYFLTYCGPLFSSIGEAFHSPSDESRPRVPVVKVMVATAGLAAATLEAVSRVMPWVEFAPFQEHEEQLSSHEDPTEGENYRRLTYQSLKLQQYLLLWQTRILPLKEVAFVLCMDSDMVVAKPFMHVFELLQQRQVDIAFSYYDGTREVPWGSTEELAFTKKKGYVRLQGGLLIMRNSLDALQWFATWKSLTEVTLFHNENENDLGQRWRDLLEEFKGPSQAALAFLLTQGEVEKVMKDAATCCSSLRSIELESLRPGGENFRVTMMGLPTQYLNDAESTADGLLPQTAHIVHLKGTWWRNVLPEGRREITTPTRSFAWNWQAFELWHHHYVHFLRLLRDGGFEVH
ncbi:Putative asparagine synthetase [glutamine-hydrolyzing] [Durusdinium trenchii]|uniref:Asparagine synthetase [glutamine-hydrolyzing] n=2 Tax=Durusdinium trenchii TaxID=1381693 RepID=A0ABP0PZN0_9DINO